MARTANADSTVTRRRILDAATASFATHGLAGVSIRSIAADAGVNSALISHYFGGKAGLYEACLHEVYQDLGLWASEDLGSWESEFLAGAPASRQFDDWIAHGVRMGLRFVLAHRASLRLVNQEVLARGGLGVERREEVLVPFLDRAGSLIHQMTGRPQWTIRFALQSIVFLVVRYGLASWEDVAAVNGAPEGAENHLEDHLILVAQKILGP